MQTYQMFFIKFWYIEHTMQELKMTFLLKITNLKYQMVNQLIMIINRRIDA